MTAFHDIRGCGSRWAIYAGARRVDTAHSYASACAKANHLDSVCPETHRQCLNCQQDFTSTGKGNRLCNACKSSDDFQRPNSDGSDARTDKKPITMKIFSFQ